MAIEDYVSCNEQDNLRHTQWTKRFYSQHSNTLDSTTQSTRLFLYESSFDAQVFLKQMPLALRCSSHGSLATHTRYSLGFPKITTPQNCIF